MNAILTSVLLICAAGLTLAWLGAAQGRLVANAARRFAALPRLQQVLAIFAICILTVCAQKSESNAVFNAEISESGRRGEKIIELSNNRIIESEEASASGSDDSRRAAENAEIGTVVPQAEEGSLSNHNSIIRQFDYSIIDSNDSATSQTSKLRAKTSLTSLSSNPCQSVQSVANQAVPFNEIFTFRSFAANRESPYYAAS